MDGRAAATGPEEKISVPVLNLDPPWVQRPPRPQTPVFIKAAFPGLRGVPVVAEIGVSPFLHESRLSPGLAADLPHGLTGPVLE